MVRFKTILYHFVTPRLSFVISSTRFDKAPCVSAHKYSLKILTKAAYFIPFYNTLANIFYLCIKEIL